ncbi:MULTISPECIES: hypothetical protein [unclassified Coleofasciculus]|uniref:hypothetical protein n=1 Tax=unclassified Coleofasciculus TaxID=2692782 RepID=UPI0018808B61|nr:MULTISPECIES: hypothetical protein [unclassified Coleofasciculus]MBE9125709.1 hypothetical protein [Coleofasciculus sp. LEGE 07081]MBE9148319.1 hypothetical protein [Coleofasciculus sp. LEGE 07092]
MIGLLVLLAYPTVFAIFLNVLFERELSNKDLKSLRELPNCPTQLLSIQRSNSCLIAH